MEKSVSAIAVAILLCWKLSSDPRNEFRLCLPLLGSVTWCLMSSLCEDR